MARQVKRPPISEPLIIQCLFATGANIVRVPHAVQFAFWVHSPDISDDEGEYEAEYVEESGERRIISRLAMPIDVARIFARSLNRALKDMGN